jgi:hypothetical protein
MSFKFNSYWPCIFLLLSSGIALSDTATPSSPASLPESIHDCSFNGRFIQQKELTGLPNPLESQGRFYFHCEHGIIWKTIVPLQETLIFSNSGNVFSVKDSQSALINSKYAKFLGQLILGLISSDHKQITKVFEIEESGEKSFTLSPKRRSIKKAIQKIEISFLDFQHESTTSKEISPSSIHIKILDRNKEKTSITSSKIDTFTSTISSTQDCMKDALLSSMECNLLLNNSNNPNYQR